MDCLISRTAFSDADLGIVAEAVMKRPATLRMVWSMAWCRTSLIALPHESVRSSTPGPAPVRKNGELFAPRAGRRAGSLPWRAP